jgi:hypothetical protein
MGLGFGGASYGAVVKGLNPLDLPVNRPRCLVGVKGVPKAMTCGGDDGGSIR